MSRLSKEVKSKARQVIGGQIPADEFETVKTWIAQCYHMPTPNELKLKALNEVLEGYGVEGIANPSDSSEQIAVYVNMGDTYAETVVYDIATREFAFTSWGDFFEQWELENTIENDTILEEDD